MKVVKELFLRSETMTDLEFIKKFSKIQISKICKKYNITRQNIYQGNASEEKIKIVRDEIFEELKKLFMGE